MIIWWIISLGIGAYIASVAARNLGKSLRIPYFALFLAFVVTGNIAAEYHVGEKAMEWGAASVICGIVSGYIYLFSVARKGAL